MCANILANCRDKLNQGDNALTADRAALNSHCVAEHKIEGQAVVRDVTFHKQENQNLGKEPITSGLLWQRRNENSFSLSSLIAMAAGYCALR